MPVFQPILLSGQQCRGRVAVLVEVLGEAAFGLSEVAEVDLLAGLGIDVPILFNIRIADQAEALLKALAFARIVNENREAARIGSQLGLMLGHVIGDAVLRLARR